MDIELSPVPGRGPQQCASITLNCTPELLGSPSGLRVPGKLFLWLVIQVTVPTVLNPALRNYIHFQFETYLQPLDLVMPVSRLKSRLLTETISPHGC